jgi:ketosteroid isomerase-like protein
MLEESATPDLVELVRRRSEASNRRDIDALISLFAADGVYDTSPSGLGVYEGRQAIGAFIAEYWDSFEELTFEPEEIVDFGHGVTFSVVRQDGRPAGSSGYVQKREAHVTEWIGCMISRVTVHLDVDQARAAAERLAEERG